MNRRRFLMSSIVAATAAAPSITRSSPLDSSDAPAPGGPGVAILLVDTDRVMASIDERIYGHFLEHINHSVEDGLFAEQIRGCGFEGEDFATYWKSFSDRGRVEIADVEFKNGKKSVRLNVDGGRAGIRQDRLYVDAGYEYDGSVWVKREEGSPRLTLRVVSSKGGPIASVPLADIGSSGGSDWQEVRYGFSSSVRDTQATVEIAAEGRGTLLLDFVSMMRADVRRDGMLRPDLVQALRDLAPPFIRWPGGSFASTYKWKDGIGPHVSRRYHPNVIWGGYSDYYGFGTEEFLGLCRKLNTEPLIVLAANSTDSEAVQYAMDWVHYLNDPPIDRMGKAAGLQRASRALRRPLLPDRQRAHESRSIAGEVRRDRQRLRQPVAGHRARGANRGVRTEAVQRHGLEPEGHRPRREELRRPRMSQLRVRARELRIRAEAHPRLSS